MFNTSRTILSLPPTQFFCLIQKNCQKMGWEILFVYMEMQNMKEKAEIRSVCAHVCEL